ncbi:MAG TPA: hypothetical protein VLE53_20205 [Gemmatimonadaceae bacterium]|nr:hypothetical protein [Gemmatimonadaceae bacterium]
MRMRYSTLASASVLAVLLAACSDIPDPVGPIPSGALPRVSPQGGLSQWFATASPVVLAMPGAVFADHDEAGNRLVFGAEHAAAANGIRAAAARMGIPESAFEVRVVAPIHQLATLRDRIRPTVGGIQIHFFQFLCTLGFNADVGGQRSFITNSHCTQRQGGVEDTEYFQPLSTVDGTVIAVEVDDPEYFRGTSGCPRGRICRFSDASRALYNGTTPSAQGVLARTSGPNNGSLEITGSFNVTSQSTETEFDNGTEVNKIGRTTGWTQGDVVASCATVNVAQTNITQLCQTLVQGASRIVGAGDSGSPVFLHKGGPNVELIGILWGGSASGQLLVFSPFANIIRELGPINATQ